MDRVWDTSKYPLIIHVLVSFSSHFLNGQNWTKIENQKKTDIVVNGVKSGIFGIQNDNSAVLQHSDLKFGTNIHQQVLLTLKPYISFFFEN